MSGKREYIYQCLRNEIFLGSFLPGEQLPRGTVLAERFGVAHLTVRRVLEQMQRDGLVDIREGVGIFARDFSRFQQVALVTDYRTDMHAIFPQPLQMALARSGYILNVFDARTVRRAERILTDLIELRCCDYLVFDGSEIFPWELLDAIPDEVGKLVFHRYESEVARPELSRILIDNEAAGYEGARALLAQGRSRIAFIGNEVINRRHFYFDYLRGVKRALREAGVKLVHTYLHDPMSPEEIRELLAGPNACDGILAGRDSLLLPVIRAAEALDIRIPEQVALVGRSNTPWAESMSLTSFDLNADELGREVVKALRRRGGDPVTVMIRPTIIYRNSCPGVRQPVKPAIDIAAV